MWIIRKFNGLPPILIRMTSINGKDIYQEDDNSYDEPMNTSLTSRKKDTILLRFLAQITPQFKAYMEAFLQETKPSFDKLSLPPSRISIFEDIFIIYMFKESEQKICSDKRYIHLLCQQLQKIIRRKDITIKERIQKKLSKLTPEDLKGFIDLRKDICFNDKKQVLSLEKKITHAPDSEKLSANSFEKVTGRSVFDIEGRLQLREIKIPQNNSSEKLADSKKNQRLETIMNTDSEELNNILKEVFSGYQQTENLYLAYEPVEKTVFVFKKPQLKTHLDSLTEASISASKSAEHKQGEKTVPETRSKQEENPVVTEESNNPMNNDDIASIRTIIEKAKSLIQQLQANRNINVSTLKQEAVAIMKRLANIGTVRHILPHLQLISTISQLVVSQPVKKQTQGKESVVDSKLPCEKYSNQSSVEEDVQREQQEQRRLQEVKRKRELQTEDLVQKMLEYNAVELAEEEKAKQQNSEKYLYYLNNDTERLLLLRNDPLLESAFLWSEPQDQLLRSCLENEDSLFEMSCLLRYKSERQVQNRCRFLGFNENEVQIILSRIPVNEPLKQNQS